MANLACIHTSFGQETMSKKWFKALKYIVYSNIYGMFTSLINPTKPFRPNVVSICGDTLNNKLH